MQTMILLRSIDSILQETSHRYSNCKIILIFLLFIILFHVFYPLLFGRNFSLYFNLTNIKSNFNLNDINNNSKLIDIKNDKIRSPFERTLGFIRFNAAHRERIPIVDKYRPFFADLHYSMPDYISQLNYTADGWRDSASTYKALGDTMKIILQNYSIIQGILYFHFDAWINPFRFDDMDFKKIWFPDANLPPFKCVTDTGGWAWWAWNSGFHQVAKTATRNLARTYPRRFITVENLFCGGWSDIYYIPRRFFNDFIDLGNVFYAAGSFHEVAVPTMLNILDLTYRSTPFHSVITRLGDCWGDCCTNGAGSIDIKRKRCGHRMDLANDNVRKSFIELLDSSIVYLNKTISTTNKTN